MSLHLAPGTMAMLIQPETPTLKERSRFAPLISLSGWPLYMIWAQSNSRGMCDSAQLASPQRQKWEIWLSPSPFCCFVSPAVCVDPLMLSVRGFFFRCVSCFWHWSAVIPESFSELFFSLLNISVFSSYQRQRMLSYVILFLLHVCLPEQKSKPAIWP